MVMSVLAMLCLTSLPAAHPTFTIADPQNCALAAFLVTAITQWPPSGPRARAAPGPRGRRRVQPGLIGLSHLARDHRR
jgi:hypothetical protein